MEPKEPRQRCCRCSQGTKTETELMAGQTQAGTGQRPRQPSSDILRETQTARPRHLITYFQKHENEEPRLQDPEGTGLGTK